jgi:hypothetical protein
MIDKILFLKRIYTPAIPKEPKSSGFSRADRCFDKLNLIQEALSRFVSGKNS